MYTEILRVIYQISI